MNDLLRTAREAADAAAAIHRRDAGRFDEGWDVLRARTLARQEWPETEASDDLVRRCNAISERRVRRAIERGATSVSDVAGACGAGATCFGCHPSIEDLIEETVGRPATVRHLFAS